MQGKRLRMILAAVVIFGLLAGVVGDGAFGANTAEPEIPDECISVLYDRDSVVVDETDDTVCPIKDTKIYFTESYTTDLNKWSVAKIVDGVATFDISWVKMNSNYKLYVCGDVNTRVIGLTLKWQETLGVKFYGTLLTTDITDSEDWQIVYRNYPNFDEDTGFLIFTKNVNNRPTTYLDLDTIEWRKGDYGNWQEFADLDLHEMEIRGGTLQFRIKSVDQDHAANVVGSRYSAIAKLVISKISVGPNITVNKADGTITIKNGQEFSTDGINWTLVPPYNSRSKRTDRLLSEADRENEIAVLDTTAKVNKLLVQETLGLDSSDPIAEQSIFVRTAGTARACASNITEVTIPATEAFDEAELANITVEYVSSRTGTGGIQINNANAKDYQIAVISPNDALKLGITLPAANTPVSEADFTNLPVVNLSWNTLKASSYTKIAYSRAVTGTMIVIRRANTTNTLPSPYRCYPSLVDYSRAITFASVTGTFRANTPLTAVPSSNLNGITEGFTYVWEYADAKAAPDEDWSVLPIDTAQFNIATVVPEGSPEGTVSVYSTLLNKYVRVKITYNGVTVTSTAVGPIK